MNPETQIALWHAAGRIAGALRPHGSHPAAWAPRTHPKGISVVIPSRNGKDLLAAQMPGIVRELAPFDAEIIVVDNGSSDGTREWLRENYPQVLVDLSPVAQSFARNVNRGIARAQYSHVCLLNNDMILEPGFFTALTRAFEQVPGLFCATAQILFPPGVRREETGKAVYSQPEPRDFPIRCDEPLPGEDLTWVLYGSGGCSLYDAAMLRALGAMDEVYEPVYVEDLDIGYRAWQRGWPTVYVAGAVLEHRHRATASRYFSEEQLDEILEVNYLRFLARAVSDRRVFRRLWLQALDRLRLRAMPGGSTGPAPRTALRASIRIAMAGGPAEKPVYSEEALLALTDGSVSVFPGRKPNGGVLVAWAPELRTPAAELLDEYAEVVVVRGTAESPAIAAVLEQSRRKRPQATLQVAELRGASALPHRNTSG